MDNTTKGALVASAVAALFVACGGNQAAPTMPTAGELAGKVKCVGVNECAKKGACAQEGHSCGGKNECAKKGITLTSADDCKTRGGTTL